MRRISDRFPQPWMPRIKPQFVRLLITVAGVAMCVALGLPAHAATSYSAIDLYPMPGTSYLTPSFAGPISGAFGGQVVGGSVLWKADGSSVPLTPSGYLYAQLVGTDGIRFLQAAGDGNWAQLVDVLSQDASLMARI